MTPVGTGVNQEKIGPPMKAGIHPNYATSNVRCSCGNTFESKSTKETIVVELCNECHPFYTGKQKLVDAGGRVDRFNKRYGARAGSAAAAPATGETATEEAPSEA